MSNGMSARPRTPALRRTARSCPHLPALHGEQVVAPLVVRLPAPWWRTYWASSP
ncbi:hypothetical protein QJS66_14790 [Kocuria rhizophila]|nr:hypothetical protein QJS66_14790 [Kocuria rhizophila]